MRATSSWAVVALALTLGACGGKTTVESDLGIKGAPDWVNEGTNILNDKNGRLFHGVGSAPAMGDLSLQIATADDRARAEVARVLSSYLDVASSDYLANTQSGAGSETEQAVSRQVKNLSKVNLAGAKIIGRWTDKRSKTVYSIAELDMKQVKTTLQNVQGMNDDLRRYLDLNADNIFDKAALKEVKQ